MPAVEALYRACHLPLREWLTAETGDAEYASDLVQDAFVQLSQVVGAKTSLTPQRLHARLARIAIERLQWHRKSRRLEEQVGLAWSVACTATAPPAEDEAVALQQLQRLREAMDQLSIAHRQVFIWSHRDGLAPRQIAVRLSISSKQASVLLLRADVIARTAMGLNPPLSSDVTSRCAFAGGSRQASSRSSGGRCD